MLSAILYGRPLENKSIFISFNLFFNVAIRVPNGDGLDKQIADWTSNDENSKN